MTLGAKLVGEFHDQDTVLGDQPDQSDKADLAVDVERASAPPQREQRAGNRERHGEHDDEGVLEALELRREHEIDEGEREQEGEIDTRTRLLELARLPGIVDARGGRKNLLGSLIQIIETFVQGDSRREMGGGHRREEVTDRVRHIYM